MSKMLKIKRQLVFESTPTVENEVDEIETGGSAQISALRIRRGGISMRGACLRMTGGCGVSWDQVDGEPMLGNVMGIPVPAWPLEITPKDYRNYAKRPEPIVLQEELVLHEHYQCRIIAQWISQQQQQEPIKEEQIHREHISLEPLQEKERELNEYSTI
nr:hypothetical protein [Tanacetum cinerariifolium]